MLKSFKTYCQYVCCFTCVFRLKDDLILRFYFHSHWCSIVICLTHKKSSRGCYFLGYLLNTLRVYIYGRHFETGHHIHSCTIHSHFQFDDFIALQYRVIIFIFTQIDGNHTFEDNGIFIWTFFCCPEPTSALLTTSYETPCTMQT